jgi:hypothetical protein
MCWQSVRMADRVFPNQLASNNVVERCDVPLVDLAEGEFAQLMALFAAWRAEIDAEPFAYSDEELLRAWRPACARFDHRTAPGSGANHPPGPCPHRT